MNKKVIKTWASKVINQGKSYNQYDNKRPIDWNIDDFKGYIKDYLDSNGKPTTSLKMFGLPNEPLFKYYTQQGTGLNNDQYWNKYKNFGGAMYDLFTYLKKTVFAGVKSESKIMNKNKVFKKIGQKSLREIDQKLGNTGIVIKQKGSKFYFDLDGVNLTGQYYSYIDNVISPNGIVMAKKLNDDKTKIDIYSYMPEDEEDEMDESKINEYGRKPKAGVQTNYAKEISHQTGTRESAVKQWLDMNEADPLSVLQGIGSGRIKRNDFVDALLSDEATKQFLNKYNSDGKWSSVWNGKSKQESINKLKIESFIRECIQNYKLLFESDGNKWVAFGSHRTRDKADRILGGLPRAKASFGYNDHYYSLTIDQIEKIKHLPSIKIKTKLPGNESDWITASKVGYHT